MKKSAAVAAKRPTVAQMTRHEELHYTYLMLRELTPRMTEVDAVLAYLIGMAATHAQDLLSLQEGIQKTAPPQSLKIQYGG